MSDEDTEEDEEAEETDTEPDQPEGVDRHETPTFQRVKRRGVYTPRRGEVKDYFDASTNPRRNPTAASRHVITKASSVIEASSQSNPVARISAARR
jgi:hypothetical protein